MGQASLEENLGSRASRACSFLILPPTEWVGIHQSLPPTALQGPDPVRKPGRRVEL